MSNSSIPATSAEATEMDSFMNISDLRQLLDWMRAKLLTCL